MPGQGIYTAEQIALETERRDSWQDRADWLNNVNRTYTGGIIAVVSDTTWTGAGRLGFWTEWRTNNPSVTEGDSYDYWDGYINNGTEDIDSVKFAEFIEAIANLTAMVDFMTANQAD